MTQQACSPEEMRERAAVSIEGWRWAEHSRWFPSIRAEMAAAVRALPISPSLCGDKDWRVALGIPSDLTHEQALVHARNIREWIDDYRFYHFGGDRQCNY